MTFRIGAHVSIAGGFQNAVLGAESIGANCGQIFTHSPRTWNFPVIQKEQAREFRQLTEEKRIGPWMSHATYLLNLASSDNKLWHSSLSMIKKELEAAEQLGLEYVVFHPGSHGGAGEEKGLERLVKAINETVKTAPNVTLLVELMAGTGNIICNKFEHLKYVLDNAKRDNIGVCLDTCHAFAAGYDISTETGLDETMKIIKSTIGVDSIKMIHLNDSQAGLGERKDRHEHIGLGKIGNEGMRLIVNNKNLKKIPFVLETPVDQKRDHLGNIQFVKHLLG